MSSQTKLIKDILSTYDTILENRNLSEAEDVYDNVNFKSIGHGNPASDNINIALLQDIQTAAKNAGIKVDITTAVSGHNSLPSRHPSGNAVDIAVINDKSVSLSNRADADKLVAELVKMGYTKNSEGPSNPKAVLTFGFKGHDDHVHVSNTTTSTSQPDNTSSAASGETATDTSAETKNDDSFAKRVGGTLLKAIGIKEEKIYSSFGKDYSVRYGEIIIPKENNKKIKSPVSGVITSYTYNSNCENQLVIKFTINGDDYYLEYCGLSSVSVRNGDGVKKGDPIGMSDSDVTVKLYNSIGSKKYIDPNLESNYNNADDNDSNIKHGDRMFITMYKKMKSKNKEDDDDDKPKKNYNDRMFTTAYKTVRDTWFKKDKPKKDKSSEDDSKEIDPKENKLRENIERIKGLL